MGGGKCGETQEGMCVHLKEGVQGLDVHLEICAEAVSHQGGGPAGSHHLLLQLLVELFSRGAEVPLEQLE